MLPFLNLVQTHGGENVYAILRAPRGAGTEAVVLSSPYRMEDSLHGSTLPGIALMVALAKYFRAQGSWAKDVIFLITEHELVGFQAWLDAYHDIYTAPGVIDPGMLKARSGPIQAAINLELHSSRIRRLDLKLVGLNGQLPNLDLFNLVIELCLRESVHTTFHDQVSPYDLQPFEGWMQSFKTMTAMMAAQASGQPNGGHGLFHRYAIQALTLEGHADGAASVSVGLEEVGRVLEGVFSSLNNLLERFHQSFFFYLLPSTRRYVSIGLYSPAFALIGLPALLKAGVLFLSLSGDPKSAGRASYQKTASPWSALPCMTVSHTVGFLLMMAPLYFDQLGHRFQLSSQESLYFGYVAVLALSLFLPLFIGPRNDMERAAHKCAMLLAFSTVLFSLALVNISLATAVTIVAIPVLVTAGSTKNSPIACAASLGRPIGAGRTEDARNCRSDEVHLLSSSDLNHQGASLFRGRMALNEREEVELGFARARQGRPVSSGHFLSQPRCRETRSSCALRVISRFRPECVAAPMPFAAGAPPRAESSASLSAGK
ncbi:hypothetical protein HPB49_010662 [Dermacentor silvarum]|uniref:Uncharacterized protein n=1 Tax=Dermacentor silvarum TaxID=543639 RepID=A0ACB8DZK8_DERSI|nr:hypothetical protein HPB49_010662 [Dermacentor silvarum]